MAIKRYYGCVISEGDDGSLQILAIGPESLYDVAAWTWAKGWVKREQPPGAIRITVWSEAILAETLLGG